MKPALVLYATREGHAAHIADHIACSLRAAGQPTEAFDVKKFGVFDFTSHSKVILIASVHAGKHEPEMVKLVTKYRRELDQLPSAFLSVSLTEAMAESASAPAEQRAEATRRVNAMMEDFFQESGWHPSHVKAVAGALPYSKLNFVVRFVVKQIAKRSGGDTDTSRDYEYTDWPELDRFIEQIQDQPAA
jgi:menaquinone-dependent protoporphyrinogen oxidase